MGDPVAVLANNTLNNIILFYFKTINIKYTEMNKLKLIKYLLKF